MGINLDFLCVTVWKYIANQENIYTSIQHI